MTGSRAIVRPRAGHRTRGALAALVVVVLGFLGCLVMPAAAAPARTWAGYPYASGQVCRPDPAQPATTTPLVSWNLGAGVPPAFLVAPVLAAGATVSSAPPLVEVGPQSHSSVVPSSTGPASAAAIAQYAALLQYFGASGDANVAQVAAAVMQAFGGAAAGAVSTCTDQAAVQALLARAADLAGPYTLSFVAPTAKVVMGKPTAVAVRVLSATGKPVPDATVQLTAAGPVLPGGATQATARTDASGTATAAVTVPTGTAATSVGLRAQVTVDTGLTAVTAQGSPTAADPSGAVTAAVYAAAPLTATADRQLVVEPTAHPVLTVTNAKAAVALGAAFTPHVAVTGMNGHTGTVTFTTRGPVALADGTLCSAAGAALAAAPAAATSTVQVVGDRAVDGAAVQPGQAGCYLVTAAIATTDATPAATAQGAAPAPVAVLDTSAQLTADHTLVGRAQAVSGRAVLANLHGTTATVRTTVTGPRPVGYDRTGCAGVDYTGIASTTVSTEATPGPRPASDGGGASTGTAQFTAPTSGIGCYRITVAVVLHVAGGADVAVPTTASVSVLSIDPQVTLTPVDDTAPVQGTTLRYLVEPNATFSQPAHVTVTMMRATNPTADCGSASYTTANRSSGGPPVVVPAVEFPAVTAHSAALGTPGCYLPVAVLTMDGNPAITATSTLDADSALSVAPDLSKVPTAMIGNGQRIVLPTRSALPGLVGFAVVLALAVVAVFVVALRGRHRDPLDD